MDDFIYYLNKIQKLTKQKKYNKAWAVANRSLIELFKNKDDMWFMMYYQMAIILAKEKKWQNALEKMGYMIHYLGGAGTSHEKFIKRLLKKFNKENRVQEYVDLAKKKNIKDFSKSLSIFLK